MKIGTGLATGGVIVLAMVVALAVIAWIKGGAQRRQIIEIPVASGAVRGA